MAGVNIDSELNSFFEQKNLNQTNIDYESYNRNMMLKQILTSVISSQNEIIMDQQQINNLLSQTFNFYNALNNSQLALIAGIREQNAYEEASLLYKQKINEQKIKELETSLQILQATKEKLSNQAQILQCQGQIDNIQEQINNKYNINKSIDEEIMRRQDKIAAVKSQISAEDVKSATLSERLAAIDEKKLQIKEKEKRLNQERQLELAKEERSAEEINKEYDRKIQLMKESSGLNDISVLGGVPFAIGGLGLANLFNSKKQSKKDDAIDAIKTILSSLLDLVKDVSISLGQMSSNILSQYLTTQSSYLARINARLDGVYGDESPWKVMDNFVNDIGYNRYVDSMKLYQQIANLNDIGIAFNLEQRALLVELKDQLVSTFDATNENLLRLIRLQQEDLTYTQMGVEGALTKFLSNNFKDTSYLNGTQNTVFGALLEGNSNISPEEIAGLTFAVQKWLGSLYSVGMSSSAVQSIATGLSYLTSGDIQQLTSNEPLNNLFAMASQRAQLNYSDLFLSGVNITDVNKLMKSIVELLQEISSNTQTNNVLKNAFGNVYGMSISDINAVRNLSPEAISNIYETNLNHDAAQEWANYEIKSLDNRLTLHQELQNLTSNSMVQFMNKYLLQGLFGTDLSPYIAYQVGSMIGPQFQQLTDLLTGAGVLTNMFTQLFKGKTEKGSIFDGLPSLVGIVEDIFGVDIPEIDDESLKKLQNLFNQGNTSIDARGTFSLGAVGANTVSQGLSGSYSLEDNQQNYDMSTNANAVEQVSASYSSGSSGNVQIKNVSDIWIDLFKTRATPIRVQVYSFEDQAMNDMFAYHDMDMKTYIKEIHDILQENNINGDINDTQLIIDTIRSLKGSL